MDNVKKIRKIAISDDIQQKALILAARHNLQDMSDRKVYIDELLSKVIESAIKLQFEKYTDEVKGTKEIKLNGDITLEVVKNEDKTAKIMILQQTTSGAIPLLDTSCKIVQDNPEMGIHAQFNTNQITINT